MAAPAMATHMGWRGMTGVRPNLALSRPLTGLKIAAVPHGFRSTFRDWAAEETNHPREVVEAALAHVVRDKVEAACHRGAACWLARQKGKD